MIFTLAPFAFFRACRRPPGRSTTDSCKGEIVEYPTSEWWAKVRNARGEIGWTMQTGEFEGADQARRRFRFQRGSSVRVPAFYFDIILPSSQFRRHREREPATGRRNLMRAIIMFVAIAHTLSIALSLVVGSTGDYTSSRPSDAGFCRCSFQPWQLPIVPIYVEASVEDRLHFAFFVARPSCCVLPDLHRVPRRARSRRRLRSRGTPSAGRTG